MLRENPVFWLVTPAAREVVQAVYEAKGGTCTLEELRERVDPWNLRTAADRQAAVFEATDVGLVVLGKRAGVFVVSAPWVPVEEVLRAHPSVRGVNTIPVAPVGVPKARKSAIPPGVPAEVLERLWGLFVRITGKRWKLNPKRRNAMKELAENHTFEEIETAFRGIAGSEWHRGENPQGVEYLEPHLVVRNFDMFLEMGGRDG